MLKIPTITELYTNLSNDLKNKLKLSDNDLKTVLDAVSAAYAAQFKLAYLYLSDIQNNVFPDTADTFEKGGTLNRMGEIYLNRNRKPATSGVYQVSLTGEAGSVVRSGITFKSNDDALNASKIFISDAEYILTGANDVMEIRAIEGGLESSLNLTDELTVTEPVIGLDNVAAVFLEVQSPLSEESVEDYRAAILESIQLEPQGGAKTDYRLWSRDAQGVKFVYPYVKDGEAGVVQVYVEATKSDSLDGLGTPTQDILDSVEDVINFDPDVTVQTEYRGRKPIQVTLEVLPISLNPVDVTITTLDEDTAEIRASLELNISTYLETIRPFVYGADLTRNRNDVLYLARVQSVATDTIESSNFFEKLEVFVNGVSQNSFKFSRENIPYLRDLIFE